MSTKIKLKRGLEQDMPVLDEGELGFTTDTKKLFIGTDSGNQRLDGEQSGGGGGTATIPVVRMDKITNTIDLGLEFPVYQLDIEPNKKYVIKNQPGTEGFDGTVVIFTPTGLDYTGGYDGIVEYNDTEYKEFTIDIYFEKETTINFIDFTGWIPVLLYTKVNANVDYTVNPDLFLSIVLPGKTLYTISMVDGNVLIYGWE